MKVDKNEFVICLTEWVKRNEEQAKQKGINLNLQIGDLPNQNSFKASIELEWLKKIGLIEIWSTGELDFTQHDFSVEGTGLFLSKRFASNTQMIEIIEECYFEYINKLI